MYSKVIPQSITLEYSLAVCRRERNSSSYQCYANVHFFIVRAKGDGTEYGFTGSPHALRSNHYRREIPASLRQTAR
jgi:hypothetical protein